MTMLTLESAKKMSNEELHTLFYDWFKDCHGFRPRHVNANDRETMLNFVEYELRPEVQAQRQEEWAEEAKWIDEMDAKYEAELNSKQEVNDDDQFVK
jgi:competence CoiA-like predicted nuclease